MTKSLTKLELFFTLFLFLINLFLINHYRRNYSNEWPDGKVYNETNCRINEITKEKFNCSIRGQFCDKYSYEIIYENSQVIQVNHLPTWFSPIDKDNLYLSENGFQNKAPLKRVNISCYVSQFDIRWWKPNSFQLFYFLLIYSVIFLIILIRSVQYFFI